MKKAIAVRAGMAVLAAAAFSSAAFAQDASEIVGQPIQVTTNGTTNVVYLDQGGQLRVVSPSGATTLPGTWTVASGQICLIAHGAQECVPYSAPFQAGQPRTLTSSCNASQTWLAEATNSPPPAPVERGERGQ